MTEERKVVYNACYGGFGLSDAAVMRAREISGDPFWGGCTLKGETYPDSSAVNSYGHSNSLYKMPRHDPILVRVVEELGEKANGKFARLRVEIVYGGYRIDEYDGAESVETRDSYSWT